MEIQVCPTMLYYYALLTKWTMVHHQFIKFDLINSNLEITKLLVISWPAIIIFCHKVSEWKLALTNKHMHKVCGC